MEALLLPTSWRLFYSENGYKQINPDLMQRSTPWGHFFLILLQMTPYKQHFCHSEMRKPEASYIMSRAYLLKTTLKTVQKFHHLGSYHILF